MGDIADYYRSQEIDAMAEEDSRRAAGEFWVCKDGRRLRPREMTTEHLRNAVAFTRKAYSKWCADFYPAPPDGLEWAPSPPPIETYCPAYEGVLAALLMRERSCPECHGTGVVPVVCDQGQHGFEARCHCPAGVGKP
jgi:hypothetical protein